ncbi:YfiR family protein [Prolixibacteraceae bacterium JC049]|nr:YfiR family protein [Prolixibacteraceae bacterium JC049]
MRILTVIFFLFLFFPGWGQENEYAIKAAYIEKFARFTQWDNITQIDTFRITVLGKNPFKGELDNLAENYSIHNKKVSVRYAKTIDQLKKTHLLFVAASEDKHLTTIIARAKQMNVLIVGETKKCAEAGGHFVFFIANNKTIGFNVNPQRIKKSGLDTDIYLMSYGEVVKY